MIQIQNLREGIPLFKALGSEVRLEILSLISQYQPINMNDLAGHLTITKGALTGHVKMLHEAGLIDIALSSGKKGNQKICTLTEDRLIAHLRHPEEEENQYEIELDIGHYFQYSVEPTCGLATTDDIIGGLDDKRFFSHPDRVNAGILWFSSGYLEYRIPNLLQPKQEIEGIRISFELGSEAPGIQEDWPSDIHFFLNGSLLGGWTSPGDYGLTRGHLNPRWWSDSLNQYGLLKMLRIDREGTFIDGIPISDKKIQDFSLDRHSDISLKLEVPAEAKNCGGMTLFGKGFGNYNQGIKIQVLWKSLPSS